MMFVKASSHSTISDRHWLDRSALAETPAMLATAAPASDFLKMQLSQDNHNCCEKQKKYVNHVFGFHMSGRAYYEIQRITTCELRQI